MFTGGIKYSACCVTKDRLHLLLSGGCTLEGGVARQESFLCENLYQYSIKKVGYCLERCQDMIYARYGHGLVPVHDGIYAVGGFSSPDLPEANQATHSSVEVFKPWSEHKEWSEVCSLNTPRAFFGITPINDQYIYVFGGLNNNIVLDSIERYDQMLNNWVNLDVVKLEEPLCKLSVIPLGALNIDSELQVMILGG